MFGARLGIFAFLLVAACSHSTSEGDEPAPTGTQDITAGQKSALRVPLVAENKKHVRSLMSSFNAKLKAGGFKEIPDFVDIDNAQAAKTWFDLNNGFSEAAAKLKLDADTIGAADPSDFQERSKKVPAICYTGDPHKVADRVLDGTDSVFTEQLGIWAWRFKHEVHGVDADPKTGFGKDSGLDIPDVWNEWRGDGDAVLILTHIGDGGDDVESSVIGKCR